MRCRCISCGDDTSSPSNHRCAAAQTGRSKRDRIKRLRTRAEAMPKITEQGSIARGIVLGVLDLLEDEL